MITDQGRRCFALAASASLTKCRIASEREGLSDCCLAQSSICDLSAGGSLTADVDSEDLENRADHLEKVFAALHVYLTAIITDTAHNIPGGTLDRRYLDNLFRDLSADALAVIRNAAEEMREHENWRAS